MKAFYRYLSFTAMLILLLVSVVPCLAVDDAVVTIDSVEFEEYSDIFGERDKHTVITRIKYTVPEKTRSVSLLLLGKDISDTDGFEQSIIYIDQIDEPCGEYEFLIERSRIENALGTSDIEGKTLYLKMGASGSSAPDVKSVEYNTPTCMTFEGAQIKMNGEQGLRFVFSIPKSVYETLEQPQSPSDTDLGFGSVVLPKKYLGDEKLVKDFVTVIDGKTKKAKTAPAVNLFKITDKYVYFTVCVLQIDETHYAEEYTAVPYITYKKDGESVTEYGMQSQNVSVFTVAELCYDDSRTTAEEKNYLYDRILSVMDPEKYPAK